MLLKLFPNKVFRAYLFIKCKDSTTLMQNQQHSWLKEQNRKLKLINIHCYFIADFDLNKAIHKILFHFTKRIEFSEAKKTLFLHLLNVVTWFWEEK